MLPEATQLDAGGPHQARACGLAAGDRRASGPVSGRASRAPETQSLPQIGYFTLSNSGSLSLLWDTSGRKGLYFLSTCRAPRSMGAREMLCGLSL